MGSIALSILYWTQGSIFYAATCCLDASPFGDSNRRWNNNVLWSQAQTRTLPTFNFSQRCIAPSLMLNLRRPDTTTEITASRGVLVSRIRGDPALFYAASTPRPTCKIALAADRWPRHWFRGHHASDSYRFSRCFMGATFACYGLGNEGGSQTDTFGIPYRNITAIRIFLKLIQIILK
jgi:hypothetical protein